MDKLHIISEIQRTARENDGVPLGRARFLSATGIREADWLGKYWVKWSDAVAEAGFEPNALNRAYAPEYLLATYAGLVRELNRIPTAADLRIRRHQDPSFPSSKVFDRFGGKAAILREVLTFCHARDEFSDVRDLLSELIPTAPESARRRGETKAPENGFVYMIKSGGHYKIGRTNAAGRRERELAIQLPERTQTVHVIATDDPEGIEAYWHRRFQAQRRNGEWFELSHSDVVAFKRRKFM